jgi:hypothetical protein
MDGRTVVAMLRGDPGAPPMGNPFPFLNTGPQRPRPRSPTNEERYRFYFQQAKRKRKNKKIRHNARRMGAPIPRRPEEWTDPGVPFYEGQRTRKSELNRVLHKYPDLLPVYFKPTPNYTILTPYLKTRHRKGYAFFPDVTTRRWVSHRQRDPYAPPRRRRAPPQPAVRRRSTVRLGFSSSNNNEPPPPPIPVGRRIRRGNVNRLPIEPIRSRSRSRSVSTSRSNISAGSSHSLPNSNVPSSRNSYRSSNYQASPSRPPAVTRGVPVAEGVRVTRGAPMTTGVLPRIPLVHGTRLRVRNTRR